MKLYTQQDASGALLELKAVLHKASGDQRFSAFLEAVLEANSNFFFLLKILHFILRSVGADAMCVCSQLLVVCQKP